MCEKDSVVHKGAILKMFWPKYPKEILIRVCIIHAYEISEGTTLTSISFKLKSGLNG